MRTGSTSLASESWNGVEVALNNIQVGELQLRWTPDRVGSYNILLPRTAVRRGVNCLVLRVKRRAASPVRPGQA